MSVWPVKIRARYDFNLSFEYIVEAPVETTSPQRAVFQKLYQTFLSQIAIFESSCK